MSHGYTEDELKFLTAEEIAALDDDAGDDVDVAKGNADGDDDKNDTNDDADKGAATAEKKPEDEPKPDAKVEDTAKPEADDKQESIPADRTKPLYKSDAEIADSKAKREELTGEKATALAKLIEGEITAAEYSAIDTRVQGEISKLDRAETKAETKAEVAAEMTQQQLHREWDREVIALTKQAKVEGIDYSDEKLGKEFDTLVRVFGQEAIANGMPDDNLVASKWALAQAHSTMKMRHGIAAQAQPAAAPAEPQSKNEPRHNVKTLGALPVADSQKVDNDPIARFATLEGEDLERAIAKMSPDEIERMLAGT